MSLCCFCLLSSSLDWLLWRSDTSSLHTKLVRPRWKYCLNDIAQSLAWMKLHHFKYIVPFLFRDNNIMHGLNVVKYINVCVLCWSIFGFRYNDNSTKTVSEPSKGSWICLCSWLSLLYYLVSKGRQLASIYLSLNLHTVLICMYFLKGSFISEGF